MIKVTSPLHLFDLERGIIGSYFAYMGVAVTPISSVPPPLKQSHDLQYQCIYFHPVDELVLMSKILLIKEYSPSTISKAFHIYFMDRLSRFHSNVKQVYVLSCFLSLDRV